MSKGKVPSMINVGSIDRFVTQFAADRKLSLRGIKRKNKVFFISKVTEEDEVSSVVPVPSVDDIFQHFLHQSLQMDNPKHPLSQEKIDALKTYNIHEYQCRQGQKCAVCLDSFQQHDMITELPCRDFFHAACIRRWFSEADTCPHCRTKVE